MKHFNNLHHLLLRHDGNKYIFHAPPPKKKKKKKKNQHSTQRVYRHTSIISFQKKKSVWFRPSWHVSKNNSSHYSLVQPPLHFIGDLAVSITTGIYEGCVITMCGTVTIEGQIMPPIYIHIKGSSFIYAGEIIMANYIINYIGVRHHIWIFGACVSKFKSLWPGDANGDRHLGQHWLR